MPSSLSVAFLCYRGNPYCGGQGVYTRYLSRELTRLGHRVTVFAGPPYPHLDDGVELVRVPSLDLYRDPDPFRVPWPWEFHSAVDVLEFGIMCTAGFPEPLTFSLRVRTLLATRAGEFDIVHDNQCLGRGLLPLVRSGLPFVATIHHPITVDRDLDLAHATTRRRRLALHRWYGFIRMQQRVAREIPNVITVSTSSATDIAREMHVPRDRIAIVPVGVDTDRFRPLPDVRRQANRVITTASADVPMKGLHPLLEAVAKVRTERPVELVVIGKPREGSRTPALIERLGLGGAVTFVTGVSDERIVELYAEAEVAVVPSLYEGFSLPAVEAMACGVPLVATTGGAIPEVVGPDGGAGVLVPPNDPGALAAGLVGLLDDPERRARLGGEGRRRAVTRFSWEACARGTASEYERIVAAPC
jgi:glycosyltransferase involved in cell wall biosynthesis